jgi:hypothetical protein
MANEELHAEANAVQRLRIEPGVIIKALEAQVVALRATPSDSPEYGNALWQALRLEDQIKAMKWRPTVKQVMGWGGNWLGVIRSWMQSNARNGSDVIWDSHEHLHMTTALTPNSLELLAARIAQAAINEHMGPWVERKPADGS